MSIVIGASHIESELFIYILYHKYSSIFADEKKSEMLNEVVYRVPARSQLSLEIIHAFTLLTPA